MKLIHLLIFILSILSISFAYNIISITEYIKLKEKLEKVKIKNYKAYIKLENFIKNTPCKRIKNDKSFLLTPSCLSKNYIPIIDTYTSIKEWINYIKDFKHTFYLNKSSFLYTWSSIIWNSLYFTDYDKFTKLISTNSTWEILLNSILLSKNYYVKIPKQYIIRKQLENYTFYISTKNLSNRWKCRKHNYLLAINSLNWYILLPHQKLNFNKLLSQINNNLYCRELWNRHKKYLFYEWVCGASTQLFRNALTNPYLVITKRYNHTKRYAKYYSNYIRWDDAAIYERTKQFEIKNTSAFPIYFFTFKKNDNLIYLISVYPKKSYDKTIVIRKQIWKLKALVWKLVFNKNFEETYSQFWISKYCCKVR